jgi:hypothetical protein
MPIVLAYVWSFAKKNWQALLLVAAVGGAYLWYKAHEASDAKVIAALTASHQAEIDQINKARSNEEAQHQAELQQYQQQLQQIQADYAAAQQQLQQQQAQEQQQIIQKFGNDADGLAHLMGGKFGFTVQEPAQ